MTRADGLYPKYEVRKADTGEVVTDCFVLRPDRDPAARSALVTYARVTEDEALARDLRRWAHEIQTEAIAASADAKNQSGVSEEGR